MFKINKIVISIILFLGVLVTTSLFKQNSKPTELRVAFPSSQSSLSYEPTKIHLGYEYIFLENVFSPLIEINPKTGEITAGLAKNYEWKDDSLILYIRTDSKTISGEQITAEDIEFSLKRLLVLAGNTHGNFKDLVCPNQEFKDINEPCDNIHRDENKIILKAGKRKAFLISMLAAIDFAIIPKSSVDPKTLAITNLKDTSGPYYVESEDPGGKITLKANPYHYRYSENIPQIIKLVPIDPNSKSASLNLLEKNEIDHITTIDPTKSEDILAFSQKHSDFNLHSTHKIRNLSLVFTEKGLKAFSLEQRHQIGYLVRIAFDEILKTKATYIKTDEFFSPMADGGLSNEEKLKISKSFEAATSKLTLPIRIGLIRNGEVDAWANEIKKQLPNSDIYQETNAPDFKKYNSEDEKPHAFIASTDTGFLEDINLISYTMAAGFFGLTKEERQNWLADYMENDSKTERISKLKDIHYRSLVEANLVPIAVAPFMAIVRKPWKIGLSELYANNQIWLITQ